MLTIVYDSRTGLGKQFAQSLSDYTQSVSEPVNSPCILVTRNVGYGKIPKETKRFLKEYGKFVVGVVVNGDRRFGRFYCAAGQKIKKKYEVSIIRNIEKSGNEEDVRVIKEFIKDHTE